MVEGTGSRHRVSPAQLLANRRLRSEGKLKTKRSPENQPSGECAATTSSSTPCLPQIASSMTRRSAVGHIPVEARKSVIRSNAWLAASEKAQPVATAVDAKPATPSWDVAMSASGTSPTLEQSVVRIEVNSCIPLGSADDPRQDGASEGAARCSRRRIEPVEDQTEEGAPVNAAVSLAEDAADLAEGAPAESSQGDGVELAEAAAHTVKLREGEEERERHGAVLGRGALKKRLEVAIESEVRVTAAARVERSALREVGRRCQNCVATNSLP